MAETIDYDQVVTVFVANGTIEGGQAIMHSKPAILADAVCEIMASPRHIQFTAVILTKDGQEWRADGIEKIFHREDFPLPKRAWA
jgi:hypothetical protein